MKKIVLLVTILCILATVQAQKIKYKFDFGGGHITKGYTRIIPADVFTEARGYGFDFGTDSGLQNVLNKGKNA